MSKLLEEAIADAKQVKRIAYENAKAALEETFQPRIQRMISSKLSEEEDISDDEFFEAFEEDGVDDFMGEASDTDDAEINLDDFDLDEEFDRIIKELEGDETPPATPESDDLLDDEPVEAPIGESESEDDADMLELEALIRKLEEDEDEFDLSDPDMDLEPAPPISQPAPKSPAPTPDTAPVPPAPVSDEEDDDIAPPKMRAEIRRLRKENRDAYRAVTKLKEAINEVSLLNSKLQFSSKIIRNFDLSEAQQIKVLETFDRATSIREVKLIYSTIRENYQPKSPKSKSTLRKRPRNITESMPRTVRSVKRQPTNGNRSRMMEGADRWQVIAGLKPIND